MSKATQFELFDIPHRYDVILADPPWRYNSRCHHSENKNRFGGGAEGKYPTMADAEILAMPVKDLAAFDAMLFLWVTGPRLPLGIQVMNSWGFDYITIAFTWMKQNKSGKGLFFGTGYYTKHNAELCLLGKRGNGLKPAVNTVSSAVLTPLQEHSRKPEVVHERINQLYPDANKLELFARRAAPGWSIWGNQVESDIQLIA